jgi:probable phosphoglycerate mutase
VIDLIVVRHGETDWNRVRRLQGQTDVALNATGIEQAVRLAAALAGERIAAIHASDLGRALATAAPVAAGLGLPVARHAGLRERHYGVLEGLTYAEIEAHHPEEAERMRGRDVTSRFVDGESQQEFFTRAVDAVRAIAEDEATRPIPTGATTRTVLIVTHGGVLDMLYRAACDQPLDVERAWPIPNAVINRLRFADGRFTLVAWAEEPGERSPQR